MAAQEPGKRNLDPGIKLVLGAAIGVHWSLALSASAVVLIALVLLIHDLRRYDGHAFRIDQG